MTSYQISEKAKEFGISYREAKKMRQRYLVQQLDQNLLWMMEDADIPDMMYSDALDELMALSAPVKQESKDSVTDEMIEQARGVKVDTLIEFVRGKSTAWCHDDQSPSLFHGTHLNIAVCPVCDLKFDAIDIYRHQTGQTFLGAVRSLCR